MAPFFFALLTSLLLTILIVRSTHLHGNFSHDHADGGPQKFHVHPTPRIGGISIFIGWIVGMVIAWWKDWMANEMWWLVVATLPILTAGLTEDITKLVSPKWRLIFAFLAAALGFWLLGAEIRRLDIVWLDALLVRTPFSLALTVFAVGGVSHAVNIIDGYNGLAAMVVLMVVGALGYVCLALNDWSLLSVCLTMAGATIGFLALNYPKGLIFAGDGGAYLWGFVIAEIAVLLVIRHPEVSAWFPLVLMIYPIWETLFSVYRRSILRRNAPGLPDSLHLHQLAYLRLVRWMIGSHEARHKVRRNSMTSPYLWAVALLTIAPTLIFWKNTLVLMSIAVVFVFFYVWLYWRIIRFRAPRYLILRRKPDDAG